MNQSNVSRERGYGGGASSAPDNREERRSPSMQELIGKDTALARIPAPASSSTSRVSPLPPPPSTGGRAAVSSTISVSRATP
jgi:hypothetical protein